MKQVGGLKNKTKFALHLSSNLEELGRTGRKEEEKKKKTLGKDVFPRFSFLFINGGRNRT